MLSEDYILDFSKKDTNNFFGYYDYSPFSKNDNYLIYLSYNNINELPNNKHYANINLVDFKKKKLIKSFKTNAFNFQDGCRMQWIDDYSFIFNTFEDNCLIAKIYNIKSDKFYTLDFPIYEYSINAKIGLTINYKTYSKYRRGYGYDFKNKNIKINDNGIFFIEFATNKLTKIVDINDLKKFKPLNSMFGCRHYIENIKFNTDGKYFYFFHRWDNEKNIYTRLFLYNIKKKNFSCILDSGKATHLCWYDKNTIYGWISEDNFINNIRKKNIFNWRLAIYLKKVYHYLLPAHTYLAKKIISSGFFMIDINTLKRKKIDLKSINQDGHPTWNQKYKNILLCDTYVEEDKKQKLYLYNYYSKKLLILNEFDIDNSMTSGVLRCDLHPRWSNSGDKICFDILINNSRKFIVYDFKKILTNENI